MKEFPKDKILNLDDNALKSLIFEINSLAGGNIKNAERLANDIPSLKKQLSKMDQKDAQKILNKVEKEKADEILKKIGEIK